MGKVLPSPTDGNGASAGMIFGSMDFVDGESPNMRPVTAVIRELAESNVPVLVLAEAGAGKQSTARRIHELSWRREQPFQCIQCSEVKLEDLELSVGSGNFQSSGTLYLHEVADLSAECQALLHRGWNHGSGDGGTQVRLICGSSRDLELEVKAGRMREDFYYRISSVCLRLPPLRQRKEDIPALMQNFLQKYAREFNRHIPTVSVDTQRLFQEYSWPGNVRELQYATSVLVALGDEDVAMGGLRTLLRSNLESSGAKLSLKAASRAASQEAEKDLILKVLTRTRWNRRRAALELQISYKALLYKLKRIQVEGYGVS